MGNINWNLVFVGREISFNYCSKHVCLLTPFCLFQVLGPTKLPWSITKSFPEETTFFPFILFFSETKCRLRTQTLKSSSVFCYFALYQQSLISSHPRIWGIFFILRLDWQSSQNFFGAQKVFSLKFLYLGLESSISQNIRKTFFEKI